MFTVVYPLTRAQQDPRRLIGALAKRERKRQAFLEQADRQERAYLRTALERFGFESLEIQRILNGSRTDPQLALGVARILGDYAPGGNYHAAWLGRYRRLITETVHVGATTLGGDVGVRFDMTNPRVQSVIRSRAGDLVTNVTTTTRESIRATIELGREQGWTVQQIAAAIQDSTFGEISKGRAATIARTETVGALNAGEHLAAVQGGIMRSKTWLTMKDEKVRDTHAALDEVTIDIGAAFANGLQFPHAPGAPASEVVNCRCTLLYSHLEAHAA